MRISSVSQPINAELRKIDSIRKNEKTNKSVKKVQDKTEFSSKAQRLSETKAQVETISTSLSAYPEIRADKVAEVKAKIENGFYDSEEFIDKLTDKILDDFNIINNE